MSVIFGEIGVRVGDTVYKLGDFGVASLEDLTTTLAAALRAAADEVENGWKV